MHVNKVSFGSTFKLVPAQVCKMRKYGNGLKESLRRYVGVRENDIIDLFQGKIKTNKTFYVNDANDALLIGFLKVIKVIPEKIKNI